MPQTPTEWATWISAIATALAALITAFNVWIAKGLLEETKKIRLAQIEPNVIIRIAPHERQDQVAYASLILENLGPGLAVHVGLELLDAQKNFALPGGGNFTDLRPFNDEIALKPGEQFESVLYAITELPKKYSNVPQERVKVKLRYSSIPGAKYESDISLDNDPWAGQVKLGYTQASRSGKNQDGTLLDIFNSIQALRQMFERKNL